MSDSADKIIGTYFTSVTAVPFTYKGKLHPVPKLRVSPLLFRGATCPSQCGGCCGTHTMDYIPGETPPPLDLDRERLIQFNGVEVPIRTIPQPKELTRPHNKCRFLNLENGRCTIHGNHGFSCDFELIRFVKREPSEKQPYPSANMTSQMYGRGWSMIQVTGERGHKCDMIPANPETGLDVLRKVRRLKEWTDYFGLETRLPRILQWIESNYKKPEDAKTLIFPSGMTCEENGWDTQYHYEEKYVYTPGTEPKSMLELGMPVFPSEPEWWDRASM